MLFLHILRLPFQVRNFPLTWGCRESGTIIDYWRIALENCDPFNLIGKGFSEDISFTYKFRMNIS